MDEKACAATPDGDLRDHLMSPSRAKSEVAWFAKREIEALQARLDGANHDYAELLKERTDYIAENTKLKEKIKVLELAQDLTQYTKEQLQENERLKAIIDKFVRHKHGCYMGEYNSVTTGEMKGCDCGLSQALKKEK